MSFTDHINELLKVVGRQLGTPLALDSRGTLALTYSEGRSCALAIDDTEQRLLLAAPLTIVHDGARGALFEAALRINDTAPSSHGAHIAYDGRNRQLTLIASLAAAGFGAEQLGTALAGFLGAASSIREQLDEATKGRGGSAVSEAGVTLSEGLVVRN